MVYLMLSFTTYGSMTASHERLSAVSQRYVEGIERRLSQPKSQMTIIIN